MANSFTAELLKLRKRRAIWGLGAVLGLVVAVFGYGLVYFVIVNRPPNVEITGDVEGLRRSLLPERLVPYALSYLSSGLGESVALILGALSAGSEYGWGTLKTILARRPSRLGVFAGKSFALGVVLLALVLLSFVAAAVGSMVVAGLEDAAIRWPGTLEVVRGMGAAWLVLATFGALGVVLAVFFKGTALAVGLGLVYVLLVENVVGQFANLSDLLASFHDALPGVNAGRLAGSFGGAAGDVAGPVVVLVVYAGAFLLLAAFLTRQRDVL